MKEGRVGEGSLLPALLVVTIRQCEQVGYHRNHCSIVLPVHSQSVRVWSFDLNIDANVQESEK